MAMRNFFCLFLSIVGSLSLTDEEISHKWKEFQLHHKKFYNSIVESSRRLKIFEQNLRSIEEHNEMRGQTWKQGVTRFSDLTPQEFRKYFINAKYEENKFVSTKPIFRNATEKLPASIDWRTKGAVTPVREQGNCSSCWAFSTVGAMEAQFKLVKNQRVVLSPQNLVDCANERNGYMLYGCNGGARIEAFRYVQENGIETEEQYPYKGSVGRCVQHDHKHKIDSYVRLPKSESELLKAVATMGPISAGVDASDKMQNYRSGVFYDSNCTETVNHGVLIVGYGMEKGSKYWLIKNSWGSYWGEDGYMKLLMKDNHCGVGSFASYPTISP